MHIEITSVTQRPETDASVYLIHSMDALSDFNFTKEETAFLNKRYKAKTRTSQMITPTHTHVVVVCSTNSSFEELEEIRQAGHLVCQLIRQEKHNSLFFLGATQNAEAADAFLEGMLLSDYHFEKYKSNTEPIETIQLYASVWNRNSVHFMRICAMAQAVHLTRNWINEPVSTLSTAAFTDEAIAAAKKYGFEIEVWDPDRIIREKMAGLLGVNRGSIDPPSFLILTHNPSGKESQAPIVIVGKGVVFDTGGINLKTIPGSLDQMKSDMAGAAAVLGIFIAASQIDLDQHLIGLIPITDNRPGKNALVPGDILTMRNGTTVEIKNTDAEGRLIMADALCYAETLHPRLVVTIATLTGSAVAAIGNQGLVAMGTAENVYFDLLNQSGDAVYERIARFPFWKEYDELLKSSVADLCNIGGREAGAITAGKFLAHFTQSPFIHLDIAGPAFLDKEQGYRTQGGTGCGVRLMIDFMERLRQKNMELQQAEDKKF